MAKIIRIIPITASGHHALLPDYAALDVPRDHTPHILDTRQRPLRDLRISVTDRCNLRCIYCMPREIFDESHIYLPRSELLTFEEIERAAQVFIRLGVQKIRLTGGEPLLRRGIEKLIEKLARLQTAECKPVEIALTTNGVILGKKAQALKDAGLSRITVSLDSLSEATFRRMSDTDVAVKTILDGIAVAQTVGLAPVKVNMVVNRGVNDQEILPMAEHFRHSGIVLRFIEYMDVGSTNGWRMDDVVPAREILNRIDACYPLEAIDPNYSGEVAERWRYADGGGEVGVIASVTQAFCNDCTRARLSADGKLYTCLFGSSGADVRAALRQSVGDHVLTNLIANHWMQRNDRYSQLRHAASHLDQAKVEMSYIGG